MVFVWHLALQWFAARVQINLFVIYSYDHLERETRVKIFQQLEITRENTLLLLNLPAKRSTIPTNLLFIILASLNVFHIYFFFAIKVCDIWTRICGVSFIIIFFIFKFCLFDNVKWTKSVCLLKGWRPECPWHISIEQSTLHNLLLH